jgi:branched-chain amino acid transport system substrate-binding protein
MKKIISMVLILAMTVVTLTACGNNTATNNDVNETTNVVETEEEMVSEETTEVFKIGATGPITGGAAVYGQAVMNGAQLAVDEINAAGGINGTPIEFNFQDDEHDAEKVINAYNNLMDWGMQIFMGSVTSTPCLAVKEETYADGVFQLTPSGSAVDCVKYDNAFAVCFSDPNQGIASAQYIADHSLATKIGVIYDSSDIYSSGIYAKFEEKANELGLEIVAAEAFTADSKSDFTTQLQIIKDAGAELVFLPIYYNEAALILSQADTAGFEPIFFGCDGLDGILAVEGFDATLAEGVMLLTPFAADATDEMTVNFVTAFEAAYGEIPNQFAADGYDAIYIIKAAIEHAGATTDMENPDLSAAMSNAMTEISVDGITGLGMTWAVTGEVNKAPAAVVIENGTYTIFE